MALRFTHATTCAQEIMSATIRVRDLPNIGPAPARMLQDAGIHTHADLLSIGSAHALYQIRDAFGRGCMNMLYAFEGAIHQLRWHLLEDAMEKNARRKCLRLLEDFTV